MPRRLECVGYLFLLIAGLGLAKHVIAPRSEATAQGKAATVQADARLPVTDLACQATVAHNDLGRAIGHIRGLLSTCQAVRVRFGDGTLREYR